MLTTGLYENAQDEYDGAVGDATIRLVYDGLLFVAATTIGGLVIAYLAEVPDEKLFETRAFRVLVGLWIVGLAHQWFSARAALLLAEKRDGSLGVLKVFCGIVFVLLAWQYVQERQFDELGPLTHFIEYVVLGLAFVHVSLCVATWTPIRIWELVLVLVSAATTIATLLLV